MSTSTPSSLPASASRGFSLSDLAMIAVVVIWRTNYTVVKEALDAMMILAGVLISRRH